MTSEPLPTAEIDVGARKPLWLRWWEFKCWFHRCPECGHRPDKHYDSIGPRWEDDKIARVLGIGQYGCRRCGHGAITERDATRVTPPAGGGRMNAKMDADVWGERWRLNPRRTDWLRSLRCLLTGHKWAVNAQQTQRVCHPCFTVQERVNPPGSGDTQ